MDLTLHRNGIKFLRNWQNKEWISCASRRYTLELRIKKYLQCKKIGKLYTALAQEKKGVAICVREGIEAEALYADSVGRTLMLEVVWEQWKLLLVAIYAPHKQHDTIKKYMRKF
uniref:Uncharacterized protein n=1 Tax=Micrurus spixii TaxID=129469 RepID=A0A2D4N098_9SAUR